MSSKNPRKEDNLCMLKGIFKILVLSVAKLQRLVIVSYSATLTEVLAQ